MKQNILQESKENINKIKTYLSELPKKTKTFAAATGAAVLLVIVLLVVLLNARPAPYVPLYTGLSTSETGVIFQTLEGMGADVKFDAGGNLVVPQNEYDVWLLRLAALGYPQTALTYDVFSSHAGLTSTESEKAQYLLFQLQDRIQSTLERISGVQSAAVTITVPESSNYVWENATTSQRASAGVLLTLTPDVVISGDQVVAISHLIAASVPKMSPEDVTVVDAATMLVLSPETGSADSTEGSGDPLNFERMVQAQMEDNVVRLLSARYGQDGVVAVAKVTIDYDKMMTEKLEMTPNEEGDGNLTHEEGQYGVNGYESAGGIVGETDNTDLPEYGYVDPDVEGGMTGYGWSRDYDYGYIKTQIESGNAILKRATISVMVNESSLTGARQTELKNLIFGATDIPLEQISVSAFSKGALADEDIETPPEVKPERTPFDILSLFAILKELPLWAYIAIGGVLLIIIAVVTILTLRKNHKKKASVKSLREQLAASAEAKAEAEQLAKETELRRQQEEIDNYKKSLEDLAKSKVDPKNEAIVDEVRDFAKTNPQIAANLIRTWLKEN